MSEAPKVSIPSIVRERLRVVPPNGAAAHPDANLLSAFAENTLSTSERTQLMDHLAACADCRNVLALALPEIEETVLPKTLRPAARFAFHWASARWLTLAATAAVLVAVVVVYRVQPASDSNVALMKKQATAAPQAVATRQAEAAQPAAKTSAPAVAEKERKDFRTEETAVVGGAVESKIQNLDKHAAVANSLADNAKTADLEAARDQKLALALRASAPQRIISPQQQLGQLNGNASPLAQNAPAGPAKKSDDASSAAIANAFSISPRESLKPGTLPANTNLYNSARAASAPPALGGVPQLPRNARTAMAKAAPAPPTADTFYAGNAFAKTGEVAPRSTSETVEVTAQAPMLQTENANLAQVQEAGKAKAVTTLPAPARWRVRKGRVQHSPDGGASWSDVNIARAVTFHQVSAAGDQVWAGGSNAVLYHSSDGGATWAAQWSYARDASAKDSARYPQAPASITQIIFSDERYGQMRVRVHSKPAQSFFFTSSDGGQTWLEETID